MKNKKNNYINIQMTKKRYPRKTTSKQRTALGLNETTKPYGKSSRACSASQLVASSYASDYLQIHGTAMGTKIGVAFANIPVNGKG